MNPKSLFVFTIVLAVVLSACAGAPMSPGAVTSAPVVMSQSVQGTPRAVVVTATRGPAAQSTAAPAAATYAPLPTGMAPIPAATATPALEPTAPADTTYVDSGVNPYVDTAVDHLSTFALDVDTASYSAARDYVNNGMLPPPDTVRIEEFVNYFRQDYNAPPDVAFALYADGAPSPFQNDGTYLLRFGVQGYQVPDDARLPATLTFVIDVSGSMGERGKLEMVKNSLTMLVDRLRSNDTVGIVVYTSDARVVLSPTSGENKQAMLNAIWSLQPEQNTNVEAGLTLGYQLAWQAYRQGTTNRVILASDGLANTGQTTIDGLLNSVSDYARRGVTLTSVGVGMGNFNDALLEQLADKGDGQYMYVDTLDQARKAFVDDLTSTLQTIAMNAKIQIDFNPAVVARYRLLGYENRAVADGDFRNDAVDAGEINAGHTVTALYAVQFRPGAEGRIATAHLRWEDPQDHAVREIAGDTNTWDMAQSYDSASARYRLDVLVSQYAEVLRQSPYAQEVSLHDLAARAQQLVPQLEDQEVVEFAQLVQRAAGIRGW